MVEDIAVRMGANLRVMRRNRGLTQQQFADAMTAKGHDSWDKTVVSRVEAGKRRLSYLEQSVVSELVGSGLYDGLPKDYAQGEFAKALFGLGDDTPNVPDDEDGDDDSLEAIIADLHPLLVRLQRLADR